MIASALNDRNASKKMHAFDDTVLRFDERAISF